MFFSNLDLDGEHYGLSDSDQTTPPASLFQATISTGFTRSRARPRLRLLLTHPQNPCCLENLITLSHPRVTIPRRGRVTNEGKIFFSKASLLGRMWQEKRESKRKQYINISLLSTSRPSNLPSPSCQHMERLTHSKNTRFKYFISITYGDTSC